MATKFEGSIISATPHYSLHEPGTRILLNVQGRIAFNRDYMGTDPWHTMWEAFDESGKRIGSDTRWHSIAFWTKKDEAFDAFTLGCGSAPASSFNLRLRLTAKSSLFAPTAFVADKYVRIDVAGSMVTPSPIPPVYPTPAPAPSPAPAPTPEPAPLITEPSPTKVSELGQGFDIDWKWALLLIPAVLLLIIPFGDTPKKKK